MTLRVGSARRVAPHATLLVVCSTATKHDRLRLKGSCPLGGVVSRAPGAPESSSRESTPSGYSVGPPQSDPVVGTKLAAWHNPCHQGHSELSPCLEPPRNFPSSRPPFRASIPDLQAARPAGRRTQPAERAPEPQPTCAMHAPCWSTIVLSDGCDVLTASPESRALRTAPPERPPLVRAGQEAWSLSILN